MSTSPVNWSGCARLAGVIVLDASVLIAHLDGRDAHHERARLLIAESGAESLGASQITLAETFVAPARAAGWRTLAALDRLGVTELPLGNDDGARLAHLRADTGRKLPDCCVLLTEKQAADL